MSGVESPMITVVTPFHNSAATLARAIDSVLSQQDADFEYILADNRSTDGSSEIARACAARDRRIRYRHFDEFIPQGPNYNRALRLVSAGARFVKVVQADDFILPGCLTRMADLGLRHPRVGVIGAFRELEGTIDPSPDTLLPEVSDGREVCRNGLRGGLLPFGSPTSVMYRADLVRARADFYTPGAFFDDTDAAMELLQVSDFGFVREVLTHTTRDPDSTIGRVLSHDIGLLHRFVTIRRVGSAYFDPAELRDIDREVTAAYYTQLVRSLARLRDRAAYAAFHRSVLRDTAGLRWSPTEMASALARLCANVLRKRVVRISGSVLGRQ